jgi:membrane-associated protease RseP (regulator of RpoE activity)
LSAKNLGVIVVATTIASTALFLGSILAHEIARARSETPRIECSRCHAVRAWRGNRITSYIKRPCDEFALTIMEPWTSIVLGFGFGLGAFEASSAGIGSFAEIAGKLGCLNVILGLFNLLPKVPPDGGHLPEATVWRITPQSFASDVQVESHGPTSSRTDQLLRSRRTRTSHRKLHRWQVIL